VEGIEKMTANKLEKHWPTKSIWLAFCVLIWLLVGAIPVQAQTATPFVTTVTVTVLDENGDPVAFLPIELHMFEYTESIEAIAVGGCGTDESGSCSIEVVDPPNLGGWMEGLILIPGLGMEYFGWSENVKMVVIQLLPGNVMATPESFLHFPIEGQDETGTDVPLEMAATLTLAPTPLTTLKTGGTETMPPTPARTETQTPTTAPTANDIPTQTPTPTPDLILGGSETGGYLLMVVAVVLLVLVGLVVYGFYRYRQAQEKAKREQEQKQDKSP
jgi:hypothetical protein